MRGQAVDPSGTSRADWLRRGGGAGAIVIAAITSANHSNTRRNPFAVELRAAQAHLAASQADLDCLTVAIADVGQTDRFAEHIIAAVAAEEAACDAAGRPIRLNDPDTGALIEWGETHLVVVARRP